MGSGMAHQSQNGGRGDAGETRSLTEGLRSVDGKNLPYFV